MVDSMLGHIDTGQLRRDYQISKQRSLFRTHGRWAHADDVTHCLERLTDGDAEQIRPENDFSPPGHPAPQSADASWTCSLER